MHVALVAGLLLAILAAVLGFALWHRLRVRLRGLVGVAEAAADGEGGVRAADAATDDVGRLAAGIDRMIEAHGARLRHVEAAAAAAQDTRAAAEEADRAKSRFVARMGHELRTPLNAILGYARLLQDEPGGDPSQAAQLRKIRRAGEGLLATINDVLELSRIESGMVELRPQPTDVPALVHQVAAVVQAAAHRKGLDFSCQVDDPWPRALQVDGMRLEQLLVNLLSSAVDRTERGGVSLDVRCRNTTAETAQLQFEAVDTGRTFEAAQLPLLFKPFGPREGGGDQVDGSGLRLAIGQRLLAMMGGHLGVAARPGGGSVFRFSIETTVAQAGALPPQGPTAPAAPGRPAAWRRILFVGAAGGPRRALLESLADCGFEIVQADDAASASTSARSGAPLSDLVLVDVVAADATLAGTLQPFRRDPVLRELPLLALLQSGAPADPGDSGADAVLHGPVEAVAIAAAIADLRRRRGEAGRPGPAGDDPSMSATRLISPEGEELVRLYELARIGNMRSLAERADHLVALDPRYLPFAERLRSLSQGFQSRAILDWITELRRAGLEGEIPAVRDPTIGL
ncbi:MAG: sensor histidine kinase [Vitreoscilla sp.]